MTDRPNPALAVCNDGAEGSERFQISMTPLAPQPVRPRERRHYTDAQVTAPAQRREQAILNNDWGC